MRARAPAVPRRGARAQRQRRVAQPRVLGAAALVAGWRYRDEPGVRFALAWVIPTWIAFELAPTKLVHDTLPAFGGLAWLATAALLAPIGKGVRWAGALVSLLDNPERAAGAQGPSNR